MDIHSHCSQNLFFQKLYFVTAFNLSGIEYRHKSVCVFVCWVCCFRRVTFAARRCIPLSRSINQIVDLRNDEPLCTPIILFQSFYQQLLRCLFPPLFEVLFFCSCSRPFWFFDTFLSLIYCCFFYLNSLRFHAHFVFFFFASFSIPSIGS